MAPGWMKGEIKMVRIHGRWEEKTDRNKQQERCAGIAEVETGGTRGGGGLVVSVRLSSNKSFQWQLILNCFYIWKADR